MGAVTHLVGGVGLEDVAVTHVVLADATTDLDDGRALLPEAELELHT
jgi:hypothetical protein